MKRKEVHFTLGSHLDLFWMGTSDECLERGAEIIMKALNLCKEHKEYCFYIETVVFADYFLRRHPEQRDYFLQLLSERRIEISGVYVDRVEHSHGGESLIRHTLYGVKWLKENLGFTPRSVFHPDLPGLSPQVPQIYAKSGIDFYLQARGSFWNGAVRRWIAPDGSSIIYCNTPYGYGEKSEDDVKRSMEHSEGFPLGKILMRGGYADLQMPNNRIIDLVNSCREKFKDASFFISSPTFVLTPYKTVELPVIAGEMPFGWGSASTIRAKIFDMSARLENLLLTSEKFSTLAEIFGEVKLEGEPPRDINGTPIPHGKELVEAWRFELFTQDHNYAGRHGSQEEFDRTEMKKQGLAISNKVLFSSLNFIASHVKTKSTQDIPIMVFNPLSWERTDIATIDMSSLGNVNPHTLTVRNQEGQQVPHQMIEKDGQAVLCFHAQNVPSIGYATFYIGDADGNARSSEAFVSVYESKGNLVIDNDFFVVKVDKKSGTIESIYDKEYQKEFIGASDEMFFGELISYEDPNVDVRYGFTGNKTRSALEHCDVAVSQAGPLFTTILVSGIFLDAKVEREIVIYHTIKKIDFKVRIYWWGKKGEHIRLSFPFTGEDYQATWYGVPFYAMQWPNMLFGVEDKSILDRGAFVAGDELFPQDRKHFREVIKWLDVQYDALGITVATRNTSFRIDNQVIEPVLLRTQYSCGDHRLWSLNQGKHEWEFTISSHQGNWRDGKSYRRGWELNNPLIAVPQKANNSDASLPETLSFISVSQPNIVITTIKKACDGDGTILRLVEMEGKDTKAEIHLPDSVREANLRLRLMAGALYRVNLLEEAPEPLTDTKAVLIKAHGIETFLVK
jgi:alpha-mannosidase